MARKTAAAFASYNNRLNLTGENAVDAMRKEIASLNTTNVGRSAGTVSVDLKQALVNAEHYGDIAYDRPFDLEAQKYINQDIAAFIDVQPYQVMNGLALVIALARLEANQVLLDVEKSKIKDGLIVTQTAPGVATYSGKPEQWVTQLTINPVTGFLDSTSTAVQLRGWNGTVVPVAQAVSHKSWEATFRYYQEQALLGAVAAKHLNDGRALEDLPEEAQAAVKAGVTFKKDTTGQWYIPNPLNHNFLPPTALHAWFLAQRHIRSLDEDFAYRVGAVVWGATDNRVAKGKADRDALKAYIVRRYTYFYDREVRRITRNELDATPQLPEGTSGI